MGLLLKMDREVDDPVSAYHKTNFKIQVDVAGEELSYVVCPKTFMRDHADGTALGFNEDGKIFLARDLHPTQMPFVALYLHYSGMDSGELSKKFGAETFAGLTHEETDTILLATVLDLAKDYLRPQEMTGLIERLKKEKGHNSQREEVYSKVAAAYLSTEVSSTALAKREEQSLEFYVGRISEKVSAHAHNKHVSTSRFFSTALEGRDKDQMRAWITSAEPAYQAIIDDPSFRANLSNVVRFLEALEGYQPGTVITLPVEESRLMYLCQNASESYRSKARPVFNFRDGPSVPFQNTENYLEITKATAKFIQAVRLRLLNVLARDYEEALQWLVDAGLVQKCVSLTQIRLTLSGYADEHYFKVILQNVSNDVLLDKKEIETYLSMVAPVPYEKGFILKQKIYDQLKKENICIDEYKVFINTNQLFKLYTTTIYKDTNGKKERTGDEIFDIHFFREHTQNRDLLYWGWYGVSQFEGVIDDINIGKGIRLRKGNIQIGSKHTLLKFFRDQQRGNYYFFGEVHAFSPDLIPNARRDYFLENSVCHFFENKLRSLFHNELHQLYYDASKIRNANKRIQDLKTLQEESETKEFSTKKEKEDFHKHFAQKKQEAHKAKKDLEKISLKFGETEKETAIKDPNAIKPIKCFMIQLL